ncbi:MAG: hypothetical protein NT096_00275 [Proteobacteria bacterium]|nr:hypothetical protein [Pseudomonadota bacterium]
MWQTELLKKYKNLKLEIEAMYQPPSQDDLFTLLFSGKPTSSSKSSQKYAIIMPRLPAFATLAEFKADIPGDVVYEIIENVKPSTANQIKHILQAGQCVSAESKTDSENRHLILSVMVMPGKDVEEYSTVWADINTAFLEDGFLDTWTINCGELKIHCNRKIMEERAKNSVIRDISILDEDVLNLKIALGASQDVNDFLALLENK